MPDVRIPTTPVAEWLDCDEHPPPHNVKLGLLTKYGIAQYGNYIPGFHIAWHPCLKIPPSIKAKLNGTRPMESDE